MGFSHWKISTRLATGFGTVCVLLSIIVAIGLSQLSVLDDGTNHITKRTWPQIAKSQELLAHTNNVAISLRNMMLTADSADRQKQHDLILDARKQSGVIMDQLQNSVRNSEEKELLQQVAEGYAQYNLGQEKLIAFITAGDAQGAKTYLGAELRPVLARYKKAQENMIKLEVEHIETAGKNATETYTSARNWMLGLGAVAVLLAGIIGLLITRGLLKQLGGEPDHAAKIAEKIASGDLTVVIDTKAGDTSSLLFAMASMRTSLAKIVGQVRTRTDTIATASNQIAAGNLDLSSRTEEQASSLEETASSMEELTSTVKQNADNARQANQLALSASEVATKGGTVVDQVVGTMASISESSKKIVDIIGVIDGIAFQTNILALNAAVEAARAGEQGRGFAVVAAEVRNLAHRSAAAAKEIKTLISDSVEKVDAGSKLVDEAGATMADIVQSITRVTGIMSEIASASKEQSMGIEQINSAIAQMDEVTQQNAALVEESAAAAASMQEQAAALSEVVSVFKSGQETTLNAELPSSPVAREAASGKRSLRLAASKAPSARPSSRAAHGSVQDWVEF